MFNFRIVRNRCGSNYSIIVSNSFVDFSIFRSKIKMLASRIRNSRALLQQIRTFGFQRPRAAGKPERQVRAPSGTGEVYAANANELAKLAKDIAKKHVICTESRILWRDIEFQAIALAADFTIKDVVRLAEALATVRVRNRELLKALTDRWKSSTNAGHLENILFCSQAFHAFDRLDVADHIFFDQTKYVLKDMVELMKHLSAEEAVEMTSYCALSTPPHKDLQELWHALEKKLLSDRSMFALLPAATVVQLARVLPSVDCSSATSSSSNSILARRSLPFLIKERIKKLAPRFSCFEVGHAFMSCARLQSKNEKFDGRLLDVLYKRMASLAAMPLAPISQEKVDQVINNDRAAVDGGGSGLVVADVSRLLQGFTSLHSVADGSSLSESQNELITKMLSFATDDAQAQGRCLKDATECLQSLGRKDEDWLKVLQKPRRELLDEDLGEVSAKNLVTNYREFIRSP